MDSGIGYRDECYEIRGAVFDVYREMGSGFLEAVYQECMGKEMSKRAIPYVEYQEIRLFYKGEMLRQTYIPDFILYVMDPLLLNLKLSLLQQEYIKRKC